MQQPNNNSKSSSSSNNITSNDKSLKITPSSGGANSGKTHHNSRINESGNRFVLKKVITTPKLSVAKSDEQNNKSQQQKVITKSKENINETTPATSPPINVTENSETSSSTTPSSERKIGSKFLVKKVEEKSKQLELSKNKDKVDNNQPPTVLSPTDSVDNSKNILVPSQQTLNSTITASSNSPNEVISSKKTEHVNDAKINVTTPVTPTNNTINLINKDNSTVPTNNNITTTTTTTTTTATNTTTTNTTTAREESTDNEKERAEIENVDEKAIDHSSDNRFLKFDRIIGRGAFKSVYKGLDTENGVPVAWCELHHDGFKKQERQRFKEEAEMLKQLQHPNIVRFFDYWEDNKKPKKIILVTELMTSGTLKAYIQRFKRQDSNKRHKVIKNFANQILKGLAYLHGRSPPVIHRDLKCDNIFVTGQCGQVKIGDLGLATLKKQSFAKSVIGTPEFMAPEMYSEQYDESVDVYAFGMCVLEMATDEYPYQDCKTHEVYRKVTQGIKPDNFNKVDNEDVKELIGLCIQWKKDQRPTVKELLNHNIFMENNGLRLDVLRDEKKFIAFESEGIITFRLKIIDKGRRKFIWAENELIEFNFDVDKEDPEDVIKELNKFGKISEDDMRYLIQTIKDKCFVFKIERSDREFEPNFAELTGTNKNLPFNIQQTKPETPDQENSNQKQNEPQQLNEQLLVAGKQDGNQGGQNQQQIDQTIQITDSSQPQQPLLQTQMSTVSSILPDPNQSSKDEQKDDNQAKKDIKNKKSNEIKLTVKEICKITEGTNENAVTNDIVHCSLEFDKKTITFKFGLNSDNPKDITAKLSSHIGSEISEVLIDFIQYTINYINSYSLQPITEIKEIYFTTAVDDYNANRQIVVEGPFDGEPDQNSNQINALGLINIHQVPPVLLTQQSATNNPNYIAIPPPPPPSTTNQIQSDSQQEQLTSPIQQPTINQVHPVIEQNVIESQISTISEITPSPPPQQQFSHPTHSNVYNNNADETVTNNNEISRQDSNPSTTVTTSSTTTTPAATTVNHYETPIPKQIQSNELISALDNQLSNVFNPNRNVTNELSTPQSTVVSSFPQQQVTAQNTIATTPSQQSKPIVAPSNTSTIASTTTTNSVITSIPSNPIIPITATKDATVGLSRRNSKEMLSLSLNGKQQNLTNQITDEVEGNIKRAFEIDQCDTSDSISMKSLQSRNDSVTVDLKRNLSIAHVNNTNIDESESTSDQESNEFGKLEDFEDELAKIQKKHRFELEELYKRQQEEIRYHYMKRVLNSRKRHSSKRTTETNGNTNE